MKTSLTEKKNILNKLKSDKKFQKIKIVNFMIQQKKIPQVKHRKKNN